MENTPDRTPRPRNRNYHETHQLLIDKASELILESRADGVSVSALARATGVNRATIYYHFETREMLMAAAVQRSHEQLTDGDDDRVSRWAAIGAISDVFKSDPEVMANWINNTILDADICQRDPRWGRLLAQLEDAYIELSENGPCDAEVYCALVLTSAFMASRTFTSDPFESLERILERIHSKAIAPELPAHR